MSERIRKAWGYTTLLFADESIEVHKIEVEPGGFSSIHRHETRDNLFVFVPTYGFACLTIREWPITHRTPTPKDVPTDYVLCAECASWCVSGGNYHQFENESDVTVVAYEVYFPCGTHSRITRDDIERLSVGGNRRKPAGESNEQG